jgi:hypothetical protein
MLLALPHGRVVDADVTQLINPILQMGTQKQGAGCFAGVLL